MREKMYSPFQRRRARIVEFMNGVVLSCYCYDTLLLSYPTRNSSDLIVQTSMADQCKNMQIYV